MRIGKRIVFVEKVQYDFKKGRTHWVVMTVNTEQGQSETYVGKRKPNTVDDIRAAADFILRSGTVLYKKRHGNEGDFTIAVPGWKALVKCIFRENSLDVLCRADKKATGGKAADKKVDLTVGGIPLGPGAVLDDIVRLGPSLLDSDHDVKVTLTGPRVTFAKKKLKISRLEYTIPPTGTPQMLAIVEPGKNNSVGDLKALYEYVKGKAKSPQERVSPDKRETLGKSGPRKGTYLQCLLTTRKNSNADQVAMRLEMIYPSNWTPLSDIEKKANSGQWKRADGQWVHESGDEGADESDKALAELKGILGELPTTVNTLIKDLASKKRDTRLRAVFILGKGGPAVSRSAIPVLEKMAREDNDPDVRKAAVAAIKNIMKKTSPSPTSRPR